MFGSISCLFPFLSVLQPVEPLRTKLMVQWIGGKLKWPLLDPIGGMILSTYIIVEWVKTLLQNFSNRKSTCLARCTMEI